MEKIYEAKVDLGSFKHEAAYSRFRLKNLLWYFCNMLFINNYLPYPVRFKCWVLRQFGASVSHVGVMIKPKVNIKAPWLLEIGANAWIGENVWIDNLDVVKVGSNVCISQGALLFCGNHDYTSTEFTLFTKEIILEDGVWVGAKAIVCPGVVCASHAVLSVGSVATKNLGSYGVYQGNPAIFVKQRQVRG